MVDRTANVTHNIPLFNFLCLAKLTHCSQLVMLKFKMYKFGYVQYLCARKTAVLTVLNN